MCVWFYLLGCAQVDTVFIVGHRECADATRKQEGKADDFTFTITQDNGLAVEVATAIEARDDASITRNHLFVNVFTSTDFIGGWESAHLSKGYVVQVIHLPSKLGSCIRV